MAPIMPVSAPLAGGLKNAIAPCGAIKFRRMRCVSVAYSPGVGTSSRRRMGPTCQDSCSKEKLQGILTAHSFLTSGYQLSNDHGVCQGKINNEFFRHGDDPPTSSIMVLRQW